MDYPLHTYKRKNYVSPQGQIKGLIHYFLEVFISLKEFEINN